MAGWLCIRSIPPTKGIDTFTKQASDYTKSHFDLTVSPDSVDVTYSAAMYDAIMLYTHAATKVMTEGGNLRDGEAVTAALRNISFTGVGGSTVALDTNGDRMESYEVMNYVLDSKRANR